MELLAFLPQIIGGAKNLFDLVQSIRTAAQQSGEWTPDHESQYQALLKSAVNDPAWKPDGK